MMTKVNELKAEIEGMCSSTSSPTPPPYSPYKWTSVTRTSIGSSTLRHAGTLSFSIPSVIPSSAREVLIYFRVVDGNNRRGPSNDIKIFTQIGTTKYEKYLYLNSWPSTGGSHNTNSDNMWFPMPPNRMVYLHVPSAHGLWVSLRLLAIGYH